MKTLFKAMALCCMLAMGTVAITADAQAGPGGKDKVEKGGGHGNQAKNWDIGGNGKGNDNILDRQAGDLIRAGISIVAARQLALDGGFIGYKPLPPGIAQNLARGKQLPPGIAKRMVPGGMLSRLPVHPGYEWRILGSDLVLVYAATSVIADVLQNVFD